MQMLCKIRSFFQAQVSQVKAWVQWRHLLCWSSNMSAQMAAGESWRHHSGTGLLPPKAPYLPSLTLWRPFPLVTPTPHPPVFGSESRSCLNTALPDYSLIPEHDVHPEMWLRPIVAATVTVTVTWRGWYSGCRIVIYHTPLSHNWHPSLLTHPEPLKWGPGLVSKHPPHHHPCNWGPGIS